MVSIILPVYKVEKYLDKCMESVLNQTYEDIEVVLVDDGSPDNCGKMCDLYSERDARVKVIHKENGGLGYARNSGLEIATGEYVLFVDSDDWLELNAVEFLVSCMERNNADIVVCGFNKIRNKLGTSIKVCRVKTEEIYEGKEAVLKEMLCPLLGSSCVKGDKPEREMCVWTNLYRKSIIDQWKLRFVSEREFLTEDFFFNLEYYTKVNRGVMLPECLYNYRFNDVSLSNAYRANKIELLQKMIEQAIAILENENIMQYTNYRLERSYIKRLRYCLMQILASKINRKEKKQKFNEAISHPLSESIAKILSTYDLPRKEAMLISLIKNKRTIWLMIYLEFQRLYIYCRGGRN